MLPKVRACSLSKIRRSGCLLPLSFVYCQLSLAYCLLPIAYCLRKLWTCSKPISSPSGSKLERKWNEKHTRNIREPSLNVPESQSKTQFSDALCKVNVNISRMIFIFKYALILIYFSKSWKKAYAKIIFFQHDNFREKKKYISIGEEFRILDLEKIMDTQRYKVKHQIVSTCQSFLCFQNLIFA